MNPLLASLEPTLHRFLSTEDESRIHEQFKGPQWQPGKQILWTGIPYERSQAWAAAHSMQTFTMAMGPLMDPSDESFVRERMGKNGWRSYIKGASALFAYYIAGNERVLVLSPPPPERLHPSGRTNYQAIEEPILKRAIAGDAPLLRIEMVHPTVKGAENFFYQIWPVDNTADWIAIFGNNPIPKTPKWRTVTMKERQLAFRRALEATEVAFAREESDSSADEAVVVAEDVDTSTDDEGVLTTYEPRAMVSTRYWLRSSCIARDSYFAAERSNGSTANVRQAICWYGEVRKPVPKADDRKHLLTYPLAQGSSQASTSTAQNSLVVSDELPCAVVAPKKKPKKSKKIKQSPEAKRAAKEERKAARAAASAAAAAAAKARKAELEGRNAAAVARKAEEEARKTEEEAWSEIEEHYAILLRKAAKLIRWDVVVTLLLIRALELLLGLLVQSLASSPRVRLI